MNVPHYWQHETSGVLRPVVLAYLKGQPMDAGQLSIMRAYLCQWIMAGVWDQNPHATKPDEGLATLRSTLDTVNDRPSLERWLDLASELGLDPL